MREDNVTIKGLWIGKELSPNELLSIQSYLYHGHQFELFVYDDIKYIPLGVTIKDANKIIHESEIFTFSSGHHKNNLSTFSNLFRYKLLYDQGGWWSDLDAICVKPYDFKQNYVIIQEKRRDLISGTIANGVIKCPASAPLIEYCYEKACQLTEKSENLKWGETGPALLAEAVRRFSLEEYVVPPNFFVPIGFRNIPELFTTIQIPNETYSIHLFNEGWRMQNISKNGIYPKKSVYETIKKRYDVKNNYLKLIPEFIGDLRDNGIKLGTNVIKSKLWYMLQAFKKKYARVERL